MDIVSLLRGILGIVFLLGVTYLLSANRKAIRWKQIGVGMGLQFLLAILVMWVPPVRLAFDFVASFFVIVLDFTQAGASFVLGNWPDSAVVTNGFTNQLHTIGYVFAFKVLPTILFFSALSSLLYYLGILQFIVKGIAWVMARTMGLTGPESLSAAANIFIGQTEAPLLIKPYVKDMSKSELLCLMVGGMATIAGAVFAAYVGFLGGSDPQLKQLFATHLLTASVMSAPAAIVAAKMLYPEVEKTDMSNPNLTIPKENIGTNVLDAISNGTTEGVRLAVNVGAMLLVFTALIAMFNYILSHTIGDWTGLNAWVNSSTSGRFESFNLEYLFGLVFAPVAWLLGVPGNEILTVGQLLGQKTVINEFIAYNSLATVKSSLSLKSQIIATYALCGFSNFASIGIQIGGIGSLAPEKRQTLTEFGIKALIGGTVACLLTAAIAGMLFKA